MQAVMWDFRIWAHLLNIFHRNSNSMETSFRCNSNASPSYRNKPLHMSRPHAVSITKVCSDRLVIHQMKAKRNFHWIWYDFFNWNWDGKIFSTMGPRFECTTKPAFGHIKMIEPNLVAEYFSWYSLSVFIHRILQFHVCQLYIQIHFSNRAW